MVVRLSGLPLSPVLVGRCSRSAVAQVPAANGCADNWTCGKGQCYGCGVAKKLEAPELAAEKFLDHEANAVAGLIARERQNGFDSAPGQHFWLIAMFLWFGSVAWWLLRWFVLPLLAIYFVFLAALATLAF